METFIGAGKYRARHIEAEHMVWSQLHSGKMKEKKSLFLSNRSRVPPKIGFSLETRNVKIKTCIAGELDMKG